MSQNSSFSSPESESSPPRVEDRPLPRLDIKPPTRAQRDAMLANIRRLRELDERDRLARERQQVGKA